ncbi:MAG: S8 family serine peptidase [Pseudobacteriovorax sp.]|nr:S8 family serine peptidase [Pseudobacteriovorax sp.]
MKRFAQTVLAVGILAIIGILFVQNTTKIAALKKEASHSLQEREDASRFANHQPVMSVSVEKKVARGDEPEKSVSDLENHANNFQSPRTTDAATVSRSKIIRPNSGAPISYKSKHIDFLKKQPVVDSSTYTNKDGRRIRATHYRVVENQKTVPYVVREHLNPQGQSVKNTYVEIGDHILVRLNQGIAESEVSQIAASYNLGQAKALLVEGVYRFSIPNTTATKRLEIAEAMASDARIMYSEGNYLSYSTAVPNDELFPQLWGLENSGQDPENQLNFIADTDTQATIAWDNQTDCSSVPVAVLDTGIDPTHPDLMANIVPNSGRDYTSNDINDFIDRKGHGTHVAGTIGAVGNNQIGIAGVCWQAAIIPVKVLNDQGRGASEFIINGMSYVGQTNAKVINMSLGGGPPSQLEADTIAANVDNGIIYVIAAGNENNDNDANPTYPASYQNEGIISVAAQTGAGTLAGFSNFGQTSVDIAAPGQGIASTYTVPNDPNVGYALLSGTSMASPHAAGAVALFWSYAPNLTLAQVKSELLASAVTGNFEKTIAGSRVMDLSKFIDTVKAQAFISEAGKNLQARNSTQVSVGIELVEKYDAITKLEIFYEDNLLGSSEGASDSVSVNLPIGLSEADLTVVVTDAAGREFTAPPVTVSIDIEKSIDPEKVESFDLTGSKDCKLTKTSEGGSPEVLYAVSVNSERECQKFCDIMGPLVYSSQDSVSCSQNSQAIYQQKKL